jgi:guanylate kinase
MTSIKGSIFIVAAPSGGGKTSLVKALIDKMPQLNVSISHTTRPIRDGEEDGVHYFFIDKNTFDSKIEKGDFVEWAVVFNHLYGTSVCQLYDRINNGQDILLDIDWQGAEAIKTIFPEAVTIFLIPPSIEVLRARLLKRKREPNEVIEERMLLARAEMAHYKAFEYLIVNDDFEVALDALSSIVKATLCRRKTQEEKFQKLLSGLI